MLSVRAIYDGKNIKLLEKVDIEQPKEIIVTFLDSNVTSVLQEDLYKLAETDKSLDFLKEPEEDLYSDKDLKKKYNHK